MTFDIPTILVWWSVLIFLGFTGIPSTVLLFSSFRDSGYGFAKIISILVVSYFTFIFSFLKIAPFTQHSIFLVITIWALLNLLLYLKNKDLINRELKDKYKVILFQEMWFGAGLIFWGFVRGNQPDIRGLEKFMDFGFVNSILRSKYLPPNDMWFSGEHINYYWFGHYITALLTKLSNLSSGQTYNLMIATIAGLTLSEVFSFVSGFFTKLSNKRTGFVAGIIAGLLLVFGGNFHTPFYVFKNGADKYWYPDATRFIGYNPDVPDKTIHEFPNYSFVVSDLHAHLINLPSVLLFISILFLVSTKKKSELNLTKIILFGFLFGLFFMTNTWDYGNYLLLFGISLFIWLIYSKFSFDKLITLVIKGIGIIGVSSIILLPFVLNFKSIAQGVHLVHSHSSLWQLFVLWGFIFITFISFYFTLLHKKKLKDINSKDLFLVSLFLGAFVLIIIPEIIYVKDIYSATHYRANTMFKLTYQAFVIGYIASTCAIFRILTEIKNKYAHFIAALTFGVIVATLLSYSYFSIGSYYGKLKLYRSLDGTKWIVNQLPDRAMAIKWFSENIIDSQPVILEAPGDSYTDYNVISSYTGLPTVSGWFVHEWLWRGDASFPQTRVADITTIYTSPDIQLTKSLLKKYNISYVIVGDQERQKYPNISLSKIAQIGRKVLDAQLISIYKID